MIDQLYGSMAAGVGVTSDDLVHVDVITRRVPGYSDVKHHAFFKRLLSLPVRDVLILGVYHGRDIVFMRDVLLALGKGNDVRIVGVDKFSDTPCEDWPEDVGAETWLDAGFGPPPDRSEALANLGMTESSGLVQLIESDDEKFLAETPLTFDAVYLDTSHDYETVARQCRQVRRVCRGDAIICGDDYSDRGTWGVKRAVSEAFLDHHVFAEWIWFSSLNKLRT